MLRKIATSYWTTLAIGAAIVALHAIWMVKTEHTGEVVSGFGAALVVLGLFVAARPFIRAGVEGVAKQQVEAPQFPGYFNSDGMVERLQAEHAARVRAVVPDVWAERVIAVLVIVIGTVLNGYGPPIARIVGWKV